MTKLKNERGLVFSQVSNASSYSLPRTIYYFNFLCAKTSAAVSAPSGELRVSQDDDELELNEDIYIMSSKSCSQ